MEGTPAHIDIKDVESGIKSIEGVDSVHDIHIWTITSGIDVMTAHVCINDLSKGDEYLDKIKGILRDKFNILHSTIQLETGTCSEEELTNI